MVGLLICSVALHAAISTKGAFAAGSAERIILRGAANGASNVRPVSPSKGFALTYSTPSRPVAHLRLPRVVMAEQPAAVAPLAEVEALRLVLEAERLRAAQAAASETNVVIAAAVEEGEACSGSGGESTEAPSVVVQTGVTGGAGTELAEPGTGIAFATVPTVPAASAPVTTIKTDAATGVTGVTVSDTPVATAPATASTPVTAIKTDGANGVSVSSVPTTPVTSSPVTTIKTDGASGVTGVSVSSVPAVSAAPPAPVTTIKTDGATGVTGVSVSSAPAAAPAAPVTTVSTAAGSSVTGVSVSSVSPVPAAVFPAPAAPSAVTVTSPRTGGGLSVVTVGRARDGGGDAESAADLFGNGVRAYDVACVDANGVPCVEEPVLPTAEQGSLAVRIIGRGRGVVADCSRGAPAKEDTAAARVERVRAAVAAAGGGCAGAAAGRVHALAPVPAYGPPRSQPWRAPHITGVDADEAVNFNQVRIFTPGATGRRRALAAVAAPPAGGIRSFFPTRHRGEPCPRSGCTIVPDEELEVRREANYFKIDHSGFERRDYEESEELARRAIAYEMWKRLQREAGEGVPTPGGAGAAPAPAPAAVPPSSA